MSDAAILTPAPRWQRLVDGIAGWQRTLLLVGVGFQLFVLLGMIAFRAAPYWSGETVLLHVVPVDPRDMFRGDYVTLSYEFSRVSGIPGLGRQQSGAFDNSQGQTIYVSLVPEQDGRHFRPARYSLDPPASGPFIRGTIVGGNRAEFGIESFYVQEGTGHKYEEAVRRHSLSAVVSLAPDGRAALRSLQVDDHR
jgi:uncharacterized membrane-anchored protein